MLKFTDMRDNPEKFFLAHRLLSTVGLGGFGIRFTVQFNLFSGSIVGLAGEEQLKMLDEVQEKGQLGCFLLTEMQAGVLSGLIVETTCDWDEEKQEVRRTVGSVRGCQYALGTLTLTPKPKSSSFIPLPTRPPRTGSPRATPPSLASSSPTSASRARGKQTLIRKQNTMIQRLTPTSPLVATARTPST